MKNLICFVFFLLSIQNMYSQQSDIPYFFKSDSSYLILNNDTADFKMYNIKYRIRYVKGRGTYYFKDSVIYINTIFTGDDNFTRFEDIGQSELKDKLSVEIFNENNVMASKFFYTIVGERTKKQYNEYRGVYESGIGEIDLNRVRKPDYIWISIASDNYLADEINSTNYSRSIKISVRSIKTNKIKVYLTPDKIVYDTLVRFELGKDDHGIFVFGPKGIYPPDEPVKSKFYFLMRRILLPTTSNKKIKMYDSLPCGAYTTPPVSRKTMPVSETAQE